MQPRWGRFAWGLAFLAIVLATGLAQVLFFPFESPPSGIRPVIETVIFLAVAGALLAMPFSEDLSDLDGDVIDGVYPPLMLGVSLIAVRSMTDLVGEFVAQPPLFETVFKDLMLLFGLVAVFLGITRWSRYQDEQAQLLREQRDRLSEQNDRLEQFASVVSHDLRNPLEVARGRLPYARETGEDEHFEEIERALDRMEVIVQDVLLLVRSDGEDVEPEPVVVGDVATDAWRTVRTERAAFSTNGVDAQSIRADPKRLRQLFENLFRNAVEHGFDAAPSHDREGVAESGSNSGSSEDLDHASESESSRVHISVGRLEGDPGGFYVEDDGQGIDEGDRERVFDAGYTTSREGTGLGLNIVREIAQAHGWSVSITEGSEGGARFEFREVEG